MRNYKRTEEMVVKGEIGIWAFPKNQYRVEAEAKDFYDGDVRKVHPFRFELRTGHVWEEGAVKLHETDVSVMLPANIDLLAQAVETLRETKRQEQRQFDERMEQLEKQIRSLSMLEYNPE
jgi:hypothetical protein